MEERKGERLCGKCFFSFDNIGKQVLIMSIIRVKIEVMMRLKLRMRPFIFDKLIIFGTGHNLSHVFFFSFDQSSFVN